VGVAPPGSIAALVQLGDRALRQRHVMAFLESRDVRGVIPVYGYITDSAAHASAFLPFAGTSVPMRDRRTRRVVGRVFRVSNVVLVVNSRSLAKPAAEAITDLQRLAR
jgi:hypothetical protein